MICVGHSVFKTKKRNNDKKNTGGFLSRIIGKVKGKGGRSRLYHTIKGEIKMKAHSESPIKGDNGKDLLAFDLPINLAHLDPLSLNLSSALFHSKKSYQQELKFNQNNPNTNNNNNNNNYEDYYYDKNESFDEKKRREQPRNLKIIESNRNYSDNEIRNRKENDQDSDTEIEEKKIIKYNGMTAKQLGRNEFMKELFNTKAKGKDAHILLKKLEDMFGILDPDCTGLITYDAFSRLLISLVRINGDINFILFYFI